MVSSYIGNQYELRDDVEKSETVSTVRYEIPFDRDTVYRVFDSLNRAMWALDSIAVKTEDQEYGDAFVYARRRFGRIFRQAYEYDMEDIYPSRLPTVEDIHDDLHWYDGIDPKTISIEKTEDTLVLEYRDGFEATDDTIHIGKDESNSVKRTAIKNCGKGLREEHAPFEPSSLDSWRYNPSEVSFSIRSVDGDVVMGVDNNPVRTPLWYRACEPFFTVGGPYAYGTFDVENQTSTVKFCHNRNRTPKIERGSLF